MLSPVKEEATATVMVNPKGSEEPRILYHNSAFVVKGFRQISCRNRLKIQLAQIRDVAKVVNGL